MFLGQNKKEGKKKPFIVVQNKSSVIKAFDLIIKDHCFMVKIEVFQSHNYLIANFLPCHKFGKKRGVVSDMPLG